MKPIQVSSVVVHRATFRLDLPALDVEAGTIVGLVGRNGAGKTTLLELLVGLLAPDAGAVRVFGLDPVRDVVEVRQRAGLMTDDMPLFSMSLGAHMQAIAPFYPTWDAAFAEDLLRRFELPPGKQIKALSKGEQTRARLVLTLAWRPKLLLLDEPATGLDVPSRRRMLGEIVDVVKDPERTVVISSHDVSDIERISDRIVIIDEGRVVTDGSPAAVVGEGRTLEEVLAGGVR